ncbi:3-dehydroquinate synthase [Aliikangiella sp. IMCC44653]
MQQLPVNLGERSYNIYIESGLLRNNPLIESYCEGDNVLVLTNETIAPLYLDKLKQQFLHKNVFEFLVPDGESHKSLQSFTQIIDFLISTRFRRNDTLVALGGGVIGDLGGYVAASYQRGMGFIQCPTSLLAQVDSSVGGKTAVNHPAGKNMIGAFYQPKAVFIDPQSLHSLPSKEYLSGFAEVIKYAILGCTKIEALLKNQSEAILNKDEQVLAQIISHSCSQKALVVSLDEKESGQRALLNLGHTFGHAIERLTQYQHYLHGEAVSIGIAMAINLALTLDKISEERALAYKTMLSDIGLPLSCNANLCASDVLAAMQLDKKNLSHLYRLVIPTNKGCFIFETEANEALMKAIEKQLE